MGKPQEQIANDKWALGVRKKIVGINTLVPVLDGRRLHYTNLDNAASTPSLADSLNAIENFLPWYSSVHRGDGYKSLVSTEAYEWSRKVVSDFFGASSKEYTTIFVKNSTEAINKLSYRIGLSKKDIVLIGHLEHHSDDLPWRRAATVHRIGIDHLGRLNIANLDKLLDRHKQQVKLVAISGASNVTGHLPDIHEIAKKTHAVGAKILVDAAQLAPHRSINMKSLSEPNHLDFIVVSAHKLYAPFGSGALIANRSSLVGLPGEVGGGTIKAVSAKRVLWADDPDLDEAGSPNVVGAIAFAVALQTLSKIGMRNISEHEQKLTRYALQKLNDIDGLDIYGDKDPATTTNRLGVIPFNLKSLPHGLVSAILGAEYGIGVRSGCFCANPYVTSLLGISEAEAAEIMNKLAYDERHRPGMVRVSFGMYTTTSEVDVLVDALKEISLGKYKGRYRQHRNGQYRPTGWRVTAKVGF